MPAGSTSTSGRRAKHSQWTFAVYQAASNPPVGSRFRFRPRRDRGAGSKKSRHDRARCAPRSGGSPRRTSRCIIRSSRPMRRKNSVPKPTRPAGPAIQFGSSSACADRPQPERRIHRMPHAAIDAVGDQRVLLAHLERHRPVASEVLVRAAEQPERAGEDHRAKPGLPRPERIVGERRKAGRHVERRDDSEPRARDRHQDQFAGAIAAQPLGRTPRAPLMRIANDEPADRPRSARSPWRQAASCNALRPWPSGRPARSPSVPSARDEVEEAERRHRPVGECDRPADHQVIVVGRAALVGHHRLIVQPQHVAAIARERFRASAYRGSARA